MSRAYGITFPREQADMFTKWMLEDPISQEEIIINRAIQASGHRGNPFVLAPQN
jgi:endonuclease I